MYRYSEGDFYLVYTSRCVILKFNLLTISIVKKSTIIYLLPDGFQHGFWYLLRARDIVINLLLCFDWIMGLFRIFLEENARLNLELVNVFFFTTNSLQHVFFPGIAWSCSSDSFEVNWCILVTLIFFSLILSKLSITSHW